MVWGLSIIVVLDVTLVDSLVGCPWLGSVHRLLSMWWYDALEVPPLKVGMLSWFFNPFGMGLLTFYSTDTPLNKEMKNNALRYHVSLKYYIEYCI